MQIPDVSKFQQTIDWTQIVRAGYHNIICRGMYGDKIDIDYQINRNQAHSNGISLFGTYFRPALNHGTIAHQIQSFRQLVTPLAPNEYVAIDFEYFPVAGTATENDIPPNQWESIMSQWQTTFWSVPRLTYLPDEQAFYLDKFHDPVWIAHYRTQPPNHKWDVWQYTDHGSIPGINGNVDMSLYNGTIDQFMVMMGMENTDMLSDADVQKVVNSLMTALDTAAIRTVEGYPIHPGTDFIDGLAKRVVAWEHKAAGK